MWMILFLCLPLVGLSYVAWHAWTLLPLSGWLRGLLIAAGVGTFLLMFLNLSGKLDSLPLELSSWLYNIGNSSIIVLLYLVMLFLVLDAGRLCRLVPRSWLHQNGWTALAVLALMVGIFTYGYLHYRHKERVELSVRSEKPLARPYRIVMLSDLHLGYHNRGGELRHWVDMVNAEKPDLILVAGDIIDMSVRPLIEDGMAAEMRRLQAPVYACYGNHEYYSGEPKSRQFYQDAGIHMLQDQAATVGDLVIVGRDDRTNQHRQSVGALMRGVDLQKFVILLDHQPYHLELAERAGVDFQLSGHTHRGQVWPISWVTDALYECSWGSHRRGKTQYYVSSGLGIWGGRYRIGTQSEYIVATIQ